jgi:penicillin-binding protein 1C
MFDIFAGLKEETWFRPPSQEMQQITVCKESGLRNSRWCNAVDTVLVAKQGLQSSACLYHKMIHISEDGKYQVHSECESLEKISQRSWFVLPPLQAYYFREKNFSYRPVPPFRSDCVPATSLTSMDLIYPKADSKIFIPRELDGIAGKVVFELAHRSPGTTVYWHLDGDFVGSTKGSHHLPLKPSTGKHFLTVVDENGESLNFAFNVISYM